MRRLCAAFSKSESAKRIADSDASTVSFFGSPREIGRKWGTLNRWLILQDIGTNYLKQAAARGISKKVLLERARDFVRIAGKIAPHWLEEASAVASAAGIDENLYVSFIGGIYRSLFLHECTSYAVYRKYAENKEILFHKNRDSHCKEQSAFILGSNIAGLNRFISTSDAAVITCMMMVNEKGLAGSADCPDESTPFPGKTAPQYNGVMNTFILRYIAEKASDCAEALEIIRDFVGKRYYAGGEVNITHWLFVDAKGTILEVSNNPRWVISKIHREKAYFSRLHESRAARRLRDADLPIDFRLFHGVSRDPSICFKGSISGMTVEIDPDFPGMFTCAWISLPAHAVSFPVLMGGRKTFLPLANGEVYNLAGRCKRGAGRRLWASVEESIHESKAMLKKRLLKGANSEKSRNAGIAIDRWMTEQSMKVMKVLRRASAGSRFKFQFCQEPAARP